MLRRGTNSCMFVFLSDQDTLRTVKSSLLYHVDFSTSSCLSPLASWRPSPCVCLLLHFEYFLCFLPLCFSKKMRGIGWSDLPFRWKREAFSLTLTLYLLWYFLHCNIKQHLHSPVLKWHRIFQLTLSSPVLHGLTESSMCFYLASSSKCFNLKQMLIFFIAGSAISLKINNSRNQCIVRANV